MIQIFPSLISADLLSLRKVLEQLDPHVDGYHIDLMDFHFVPNLTWGPEMVNALRSATKKPFMVHLMVDYPEQYFDRFSLQKDDIVCVHPESPSEKTPEQLMKDCKNHGWIPSLALNPDTPISILKDLTLLPEHILLMSVNPGFSGQAFMPIVYDKLGALSELSHSFITAIDGGVNLSNALGLQKAGADQLAIGSALFTTPDPVEALKAYRKLLRN